jgi:hypothetical protein
MTGHPIPQKMEDGIERVFPNPCANSENFKKRGCAPNKTLFHWPQGLTGEVWAVYSDRAAGWLAADNAPKFCPDANSFHKAAYAAADKRL